LLHGFPHSLKGTIMLKINQTGNGDPPPKNRKVPTKTPKKK
jgi:hypothetical protein